VIYDGLPLDIDVIANQEGYASVSPLQFNLTAYDFVKEIEDWGIK
jgi:hypothetical protein